MSVPTRAGFSQNPTEFREFETQWGLYSIQVPLQPIGRLYWENSGLSELSTQNIGQREHSWVWGWGIRYPCHWRARSLGSKRPSGIYSRRDVLSDHISGYVGKTGFSRNRGTKMTENGNFCIVLQCVGTNLGWFLTEPH